MGLEYELALGDVECQKIFKLAFFIIQEESIWTLNRLQTELLSSLSRLKKLRAAALSSPLPGGLVDGKEVEMYVKVGDRVITGKYSGTEVKLNKEEYTIVRQSDILAIVE